jgi:hypothetical protein
MTIDGSGTKVIDYDVIEIIRDFKVNAKNRNISVVTKSVPGIDQVAGPADTERENVENEQKNYKIKL